MNGILDEHPASPSKKRSRRSAKNKPTKNDNSITRVSDANTITHAQSSSYSNKNSDTNKTQNQSGSRQSNTNHITILSTFTPSILGNKNPPHPPSASASASPASSAQSHSQSQSSLPPSRHQVHRCRFFDYHPAAITALSFSLSGHHLAVGRDNGDIEIWNTNKQNAGRWIKHKVIPGTGQTTIQAVIWSHNQQQGDRLFSAGLNGRLIEWDLLQLIPKFVTDSYGGAVWAAAAKHGFSVSQHLLSSDPDLINSPSSLSITLACEDGTLRLFDASDTQSAPAYVKALARHSSRVLSCCWPEANTIISGGEDGSLRAWDIIQGRNVQRITVGASTNNIPHIWSLCCTRDTIITGDSLGIISVFDRQFGTLTQTFQHHKADILCMVLTADQHSLYAAGVDQSIAELKKLDNGKWVLTIAHRTHTHDIFALAISPTFTVIPASIASTTNATTTTPSTITATHQTDSYLVSGGVDTQLIITQCAVFATKKPLKLLPFPHRSVVDLSGNKLLIHQRQTLSLYELGEVNTQESQPGIQEEEEVKQIEAMTNDLNDEQQHLSLSSSSYTHLLDINLSQPQQQQQPQQLQPQQQADSSNSMERVWQPLQTLNISCAALSPDAHWIACSDTLHIRLYHLSYDRQYTTHRSSSTTPSSSGIVITKTDIHHLLTPSYAVTFSPDSKYLLAAGLNGELQLLDLHTMTVSASVAFHSTFDRQPSISAIYPDQSIAHLLQQQKRGVVCTVVISSDGNYCVAANEHNSIHVYAFPSLTLLHSLPVFPAPYSALAFHPTVTHLLFVTTATNHVYVWNVTQQQLTAWCKQLHIAYPTTLLPKSEKIVHITIDVHSSTGSSSSGNSSSSTSTSSTAGSASGGEEGGGKLLLVSHSWICVVDLNRPFSSANSASVWMSLGRRKRSPFSVPAFAASNTTSLLSSLSQQQDDAMTAVSKENENFRLVTRYRPLLFAGFMQTRQKIPSTTTALTTEARPKKKKKSKKQQTTTEQNVASATSTSIHADAEHPSALVVVECPWLRVLQSFAQPMARKKYGT